MRSLMYVVLVCVYLTDDTAGFLPVCHSVLKIIPGKVHEHHKPAGILNFEIGQVLR